MRATRPAHTNVVHTLHLSHMPTAPGSQAPTGAAHSHAQASTRASRRPHAAQGLTPPAMADAAAAPASAAAAAASPAPVHSAAARAARGEAPVKAEFVRNVTARQHIVAVTGQMGAGGGGAGAGAAPAGEGERQRDVLSKSKKQAKKVGAASLLLQSVIARAGCGWCALAWWQAERCAATQLGRHPPPRSAPPDAAAAGAVPAALQQRRAVHRLWAGQVPLWRQLQVRGAGGARGWWGVRC